MNFLPQFFPFPNPIINYISEKPNRPIPYFKLINCCKYFYYKNEIIISYYAISTPKFSYTTSRWKIGPYTIAIKDFESRTIKLDKFPSCKLWIFKKFVCITDVDINQLIPRIYQCDAIILKLKNQKLLLKDFRFLAVCAENLYLDDVVINEENGNGVLLETIISIPRNLLLLEYSCSPTTISTETMKEINQLKNLENLKSMRLFHVPPIFDIEAFADFFENHKTASFYLCFYSYLFRNITDINNDQKKKIDGFIDMLIESTEKLKIQIHYPGMDAVKYSKLRDDEI